MLSYIVIKEIVGLNTVCLEKGSCVQIQQRKSFGLSFCVEGYLTFEYQGKTFVSDPNHAVLLPQGASYCHTAHKSGVYPVINFTCDGIENDFLSIPLESVKPLWTAYQRIKRLRNDAQYRLLIIALMYELLHSLPVNASADGEMREIKKCVDTNLHDPSLNNQMLADTLCLSESYFRKKFLKAMGMSPRQYILHQRILRAENLLAEGTMPVAAVAEACGFASVYHFSRAFHQRVGLTPTQYAARHRTLEI